MYWTTFLTFICKISTIILLLLSLLSCQQASFVPADIIVQNAHGGGSVVKFNNKETFVASGGWSGHIRFWSVSDGRMLLNWRAHKGQVSGIVFTKEDKLMITTGYDSYIRYWSTQGTLVKEKDAQSKILAMTFNEQDDVIITGHNDGYIRVWQLSSLQLLRERKQHNSAVRAVAYAIKDGTIASSGSSADVMLWPLNSAPEKLASPFTDIRSLTFANNDTVLLGSGWFNLYRWTLEDKNMHTLKTEHRGIIQRITLFDGGSTLASISRQTDSAVLFLDPATGQLKQRFQSHDLCGVDVSVSINNKYLATTSDDASVRIWRLKE